MLLSFLKGERELYMLNTVTIKRVMIEVTARSLRVFRMGIGVIIICNVMKKLVHSFRNMRDIFLKKLLSQKL